MTDRVIKTLLVLGTELSALEELEAGLESFSEEAQLSTRDHFQIRLALDELVTNSVSYGFVSGAGSGISIYITLHPDRTCEIVYTDDAPRFDPLAQPVPPEKSSTEEAHFGGFGISLVTQMMSEVSYSYENGRNIIKMKKKMAAIDA